MRHTLIFSLLVLGTAATVSVRAEGSRIKDLAMVAGARDNQLAGYGLVVGLAGDGDKNPVDTLQTIGNLLQRYGLTVPAQTISAKNVAIVMVTADIPAFAKPGSRLDVVVASMGDAKSLQGGVLIQTPLLGADGKPYAIAQGTLSIGGLSASGGGDGGGASVSKNHPTVGTIINGALVEREIPATIVSDNHLELLLRNPDFTSSSRMAAVLNSKFPLSAVAVDATTVRVGIPITWSGTSVDFISQIETLELTPDVPARVIINERTGTIVATALHSHFQLRHFPRQRDDQHRIHAGSFATQRARPGRHPGHEQNGRKNQRGQGFHDRFAGVADRREGRRSA